MNLYLITLKNYDSFYVIAKNTDEAYATLLEVFKDYDLYFSSDRQLKSIEVLAIGEFYKDNLFKQI